MDENKQMKMNNTTLTLIIGIATLLISIVGATFAYFTATVTGNEIASSINIDTASLSLTYDGTSVLSLPNALPGASQTRTFTIRNTGNNVANYKLSWINVSNTFVDQTDLVYSLSCGAGVGTAFTNRQAPSAAGDISGFTNISIASLTTQTCTFTLTFKETGNNQDDNQNKTFHGTINVTALGTSAM